MPREKINGILKNFLLLVAVLIAIAFLLEIVLRLTYPYYKDYNTEMWRYSVLLKTASPNPHISHEHIPNTEAFLYGVDVKISSYGFRDREYSLEKPSNTYRIMVLGDSFTLGWGVPIEDTYSKVLERMLNNNTKGKKFEVINTALGNYNTEMEYEMFREKGIKFNPDMVIVGYYPNDVELTLKFDPKSFSILFKKNSYMYAFFWDRMQNIKSNINSIINKNSYTGYVHEQYKSGFKGRNIMENSLNGLIDISKKNNIVPVVAVLPQFFGDFDNYEFKEVYPIVSNITRKKGVLSIDITQNFKAHAVKDVIVSFEDAHPNKLAHRMIAEAIYQNVIGIIENL